MPFLEPTNDFIFKSLFGREDRKEILINFLNSILNKVGKESIQDITILGPHQAPQIAETRRTIVDVKCRDQSGTEYIVEMQVAPERVFDKRILYYVSQAYSQQLKSGQDYDLLTPIVFLGVLDFNLTQNHHYLSTHLIHDVETNEHVLRDFQFTFIELPKFTKKKDELKTISDQWIFFLKNANHFEQTPEVIHEQAVRWAFEVTDRVNWSPEELLLYEEAGIARKAEEMRVAFGYDKGRMEGREEGLEKGREEGEKKGKVAVALNLLEQRIDEKIVAQATGLSSEELKKLQSKLCL